MTYSFIPMRWRAEHEEEVIQLLFFPLEGTTEGQEDRMKEDEVIICHRFSFAGRRGPCVIPSRHLLI